jgi:uncharacterized membrane protein
MIEPYTLLKFLHVAAAIVWLGGAGALAVLTARLAGEPDRAALAALLRHGAAYGRAVVGPAAIVTLVAGMAAAARAGVGFGTPWLAWGFVGIVGSLLLTALPIRRAAAELGRLAAGAGPGDPRLDATRRRLTALNAANLLLLLSVVWAMVAKPSP